MRMWDVLIFSGYSLDAYVEEGVCVKEGYIESGEAMRMYIIFRKGSNEA